MYDDDVRWPDLVQALRDAGWSMAGVAREVGVSRQTVYRWLSGEREPYGRHAVRLLGLAQKGKPGHSGARA